MHFWHDIPIGEELPDKIHLVVEIPRHSNTKYELDHALGVLRVDRILQGPIYYPANYGFIPQTLAEDGDPLDALVLMQDSLTPLTILQVCPIGIIKLVDEDQQDDKIICVHPNDPLYRAYSSLEQLSDYEMSRLEWFFNNYKDWTKKQIPVTGFYGAEDAKQVVKNCWHTYKQCFLEK